jgi:hypothetical protein
VYANDFQRHSEEIQKEANKKNVEVALTCVRGHQKVRDEKIGSASHLKADLPTRKADR